MALLGFSPEAPVIVCGVRDGHLTEDGQCSQEFPNFEEAKKVFPDFDPAKNTKRFTWAMGNGESSRFETWKANDLYAI